jgi:hypothetical protein
MRGTTMVAIARTLWSAVVVASRALWGVIIVAVMAAFAVTGYVYYDIHNACRVGNFRIVQDDKEFAPAGRVVCGDRKGFFWVQVDGDDSFVTMSLGTDDPFNKRFEFPGNGAYLDGNKCEREDR